MVMEMEPKTLEHIKPVLRERRGAVLSRISTRENALREDFAELQILDYQRSFDECVALVKMALE